MRQQQAYAERQQQALQIQRLVEANRRQQQQQPVEEVILDEDGAETIELDGTPEFVSTDSTPRSRRGRPRLDPETDDPLVGPSPGQRAIQQMRALSAAANAAARPAASVGSTTEPSPTSPES
jgi:hypothetical protein